MTRPGGFPCINRPPAPTPKAPASKPQQITPDDIPFD